MRFHLGSFPESADFIPDNSWRSFDDKEQPVWIWQLKAFPVAIINMIVIILSWMIFTSAVGILKSITFPLPIVGFLICLVGVLIIHELIHVAVHPMSGFSTRSIIGFWPSRMLLYAAYDGEINRNRYLAILIIPFILISIIPILIAAVAPIVNLWIVYITILNAFLASGDVLAAITILKLPTNAIIRSHGNTAHWKENVNIDKPRKVVNL